LAEVKGVDSSFIVNAGAGQLIKSLRTRPYSLHENSTDTHAHLHGIVPRILMCARNPHRHAQNDDSPGSDKTETDQQFLCFALVCRPPPNVRIKCSTLSAQPCARAMSHTPSAAWSRKPQGQGSQRQGCVPHQRLQGGSRSPGASTL
jgi:hypothetical protein